MSFLLHASLRLILCPLVLFSRTLTPFLAPHYLILFVSKMRFSTSSPHTKLKLPSRMLRRTAVSISFSDCSIYLSNNQKFPISGRFQSGDPSAAFNYRPISLLSLVSKIMERIIHTHLMEYLLSNHLIAKCQFGFRPRSSTQEALLTVANDWHNMLSTHRQVASICFDIRKAFDSVPHDKLISALRFLLESLVLSFHG